MGERSEYRVIWIRGPIPRVVDRGEGSKIQKALHIRKLPLHKIQHLKKNTALNVSTFELVIRDRAISS
jgi:hypothetical protein